MNMDEVIEFQNEQMKILNTIKCYNGLGNPFESFESSFYAIGIIKIETNEQLVALSIFSNTCNNIFEGIDELGVWKLDWEYDYHSAESYRNWVNLSSINNQIEELKKKGIEF